MCVYYLLQMCVVYASKRMTSIRQYFIVHKYLNVCQGQQYSLWWKGYPANYLLCMCPNLWPLLLILCAQTPQHNECFRLVFVCSLYVLCVTLSLSLFHIWVFLSVPLINQTYWWLDIILILFAVYGLFIESIEAFFFCIKSTTAIGFRYETTSCCIKAIRMTRTNWLFLVALYIY